MELHYGTISARNNEGEKGSKFEHGSEFTIRIPLGNAHLKPEEKVNEEDIKDEPTLLQEMELENNRAMTMETNPQTEAEELTNNTKGGKATLAIVEDEDDIRDFLCTQFADDFKVLTYHNGKEALLEIVKLQPDLIISDVMMPEMDGMTLCSKIKANVNTNHIPVILLTAKSREEDQLEGLETGADAYILKPFNMDILRRTVINLLTTRRTLRNKFNGNDIGYFLPLTCPVHVFRIQIHILDILQTDTRLLQLFQQLAIKVYYLYHFHTIIFDYLCAISLT